MKFIFKKFLRLYLKTISKLVLFIYRPKIIAIAGSLNKYFVKEKLKNVLEEEVKIRAGQNSFNTDIGLCLAILNLPSGYNSFFRWLPILLRAPLKIFDKNYPKYLILEIGVSNPKDMKYLLSIIKPEISIITDITQRYLETFSSLDSLIKEYELLAQKTSGEGILILNADNEKLKNISKYHSNIKYFGFNPASDSQIIETKRIDTGQNIIFKHNNILINENINRFGKHHAYASAISIIVKNHILK
jgi:UDP-N-acetylmuramyl pentapeptide synthase